MCGICGRLNFEGIKPVEEQEIRRMCAPLKHRGPDDQGIYISRNFGMGFRRLAVIDLETGHQPISNENRTVWLTCNGEIYNFKELRQELEKKGHRFRSRTDIEVIIHLYEEYGLGFIHQLQGMFGFALWDDRRKRLVLGRDRLGIHPVFYYLGPDRVTFGSEIKPILADGVPRALNEQALHDYLSFNYVPGPLTMFRDIFKLLPAHLLIGERGQVRTERYWDIQFADRDGRKEPEVLAELEEVLLRTMRSHLVADRPLGIFLSGGMDSSALVSLARQAHSGRLSTFSIGFPEKTFDETKRSQLIADRYGTDHHQLVVDIKPQEILPKLVHYFDEPFADSSAIPVYYLAEMARRQVVVALGGDGGDEIFAGYDTYTALKLARSYRRLPSFLSARLIPALVKQLPVSHAKVSFDFKAKRFVAGALMDPDRAHYQWKMWLDEKEKQGLYAEPHPELRNSWRILRAVFNRCQSQNLLSRMQYADCHPQLADDMCVKVDRMTMAHSLELRVPFLSDPVVEFVAGLDPELRMRGLRKKYILKRLMADRLPDEIRHGKKRGFNIPLPSWLLGPLRETVRDELAPERLRRQGIFKPEAVSRMVDDHLKKRIDYSRPIWALLIFVLWHRTYLEDSI